PPVCANMPLSMGDFRELIDLASEQLGGAAIFATDEFFAEKENLLKASEPVWKEHEYTDRGKWMDGWESRRKRTPGHDYSIIRLGLPGVLHGVVVNTSFFRGNYPDSCSIEATYAAADADITTLLAPSTEWIEVLAKSHLAGDRENPFRIDHQFAFTHLRFNIYPDGGVARLRVHGKVIPDWRRNGGMERELDLAAVENGGDVLSCSDMFFGRRQNMIMPGRALNMSDGWETKRRRGDGHDWAIVQLGAEGSLRRLEIDTNHFKGNYPDTASVEGCVAEHSRDLDRADWMELLPRMKLQAHTRHWFSEQLLTSGPFTHLRLNVYPDGGVSRFRAHGTPTEHAIGQAVARRLSTLPRVGDELRACCGSSEWVRRMEEARPFQSWDKLVEAANEIWWSLTPADWQEAFRSHPRIGSTAGTAEKSTSPWSASEQSRAMAADRTVLDRLDVVNLAYEERFGNVFIICASGKPADEILAEAERRMKNAPDEELREAAEEQRRITHLRLKKLVR
ncbi:MAG: allantoicase, partial [Acidobacteriota bacterium]